MKTNQYAIGRPMYRFLVAFALSGVGLCLAMFSVRRSIGDLLEGVGLLLTCLACLPSAFPFLVNRRPGAWLERHGSGLWLLAMACMVSGMALEHGWL